MDGKDSGPGHYEKFKINRRNLVRLAGGTAAASFVGLGQAQEEQEDFVQIIGTDPTDYPEVDVSVYVDSQAGRDGELTAEDFKVYEEGTNRPVTSLEFSSSGLDLVFVFDDSGSMGNEIGTMQEEVNSLATDLNDAGIDAQYGLVSFRDSTETDLNLTEDVSELQSAVDELNAAGGGDPPEANFEAIERALDFDFRSSAQKVLVDITDAKAHYDGDGSGVSDYTLSEVAEDLQESGANYVAVSPGYDDPDASKKALADEASGLWVDINDTDFSAILQNITQKVIDTYIVSYSSSTSPNTDATVDTEVTDPNKGTGSASSTVRIPKSSVIADATIAETNLPPTAVETDESFTFTASLESIGPDPSSLSTFPTVEVSWREQDLGTIEPELEDISNTTSSSAEYTFRVPSAEDLISQGTVSGTDITPEGIGISVTIESTGSGQSGGGTPQVVPQPDVRTNTETYAFRKVETVGVAPVLPNDVPVNGSHTDSPSQTGQSLFQTIRTHAEFVNQYYAGGFGSMGAHGFDFRTVTQERTPASGNSSDVVDGWLKLDGSKSDYDDGGPGSQPENTMGITENAGEKLATIYDVTWESPGADYETLFTVGSVRYSKAYCRGSIPPEDVNETVAITDIGLEISPEDDESSVVEVPISYFSQFFEINPVRTSSGNTDAIYIEINGDAWRHELGHSLGPENQIGLPDLYAIDGIGNLGVIHNWGLMGFSEGDTMTAYSRRMGGDLYSFDGWAGSRHHFHAFELSMSPDPLSEMRIGDNVDVLYSGSIEYALDVPGTDASVPGTALNLDRYFVEARKSESIPGSHPDEGTLSATPSGANGIALYKYASLELEPAPEDASGFSEELIGRMLPTLNYHENPQGGRADPTLTHEESSSMAIYHDPESAITFEITDGFSGNGPEVEVRRDPVEYLPGSVQDGFIFAADLLAEPTDFALNSWSSITEGIDDVGSVVENVVSEGGDLSDELVTRGDSVVAEVSDGGEDLVIWGFENGEDVTVDTYDGSKDVVVEGIDGGEAIFESGQEAVISGADTGTDTAVDIYEGGEEITISGLETGTDVITDVGGTGQTTIENGADALPDEVTDTADDAADCVSNPGDCLPSGGSDLPGLDILVEREDGKRVGIDPETGERLTEIEDARVLQQGSRTLVTVPGHPSVDVTMSATRLRDAMEESTGSVPEEIGFERTVLVDDGTTVRDLDGLPFLDGRVRQRSTEELELGADDVTVDAPILSSVSVDLNPGHLNARSQGRFVTAWVGLPESMDSDDLFVGSLLLDGVQSISDERFGFVENPAVRETDGRSEVMVKFPRQDLLDRLDEGTHDLTLTGTVGETMIRGSVELQVRYPGRGRGAPEDEEENGHRSGGPPGHEDGHSGRGRGQ